MTIVGRYVGYARVSREDQDLGLQLKAMREFGIDENFVFKEHISTKKTRRPQFELALKRCRAGDTVVVWKLDRFGRDMEQIVSEVSKLAARGVKIKSLTENIDSSTPIGKFTYHIMAAQAQFERDTTSERTAAGIDNAKDRGTWRSRPTVFTAKQWNDLVKLVQDPKNDFVNNKALAEVVSVKPNMVAAYRKELKTGISYEDRFPTGDKASTKEIK